MSETPIHDALVRERREPITAVVDEWQAERLLPEMPAGIPTLLKPSLRDKLRASLGR